MTPERANKLMERSLSCRPVKAVTPLGKRVAGLLLGHDGLVATIRRCDGKKDFKAPLQEIAYR